MNKIFDKCVIKNGVQCQEMCIPMWCDSRKFTCTTNFTVIAAESNVIFYVKNNLK